MASVRRRCVLGCANPRTLFSLPKQESSRQKWLQFIYRHARPASQILLCDQHFTDDCFTNLGLFKCGISGKLCLENYAIPTIPYPLKSMSLASSSPTGNGDCHPSSSSSTSVRSVSVQTVPSVFCRTVSTQLSTGTLRPHHVRSKAVQAALQHWPDLPCTPLKDSAPGFSCSPMKRPRLEEECEEVKEEEDVDMLPDESTYEPGASTSAASTSAASEPSVVIKEEHTSLEEAKYIVFESSLKELFDTCPVCKRHCKVTRSRCGTFVSLVQRCLHCQYSRKWQSGPIVGSTPVGDLQLSAAVYFSGASFPQVARVCNAMNIQIHQNNTFTRHSQRYLEPSVCHKWSEDQRLHLQELKKTGRIAVSGDMRAPSPGHSAEYGTYTLMDVQSEKIVDMKLVQSSEVDGSSHMETEGLRRCLDFLEANGVEVESIVTDRHPQIQKFLSEKDITQYYDVWHVVAGLSKKLHKLSKDKDFEVVKKWLSAIKNHMYWTASSSTSGPEKVSKWTSFLNHIQNVHTHEDPLFPKCLHPEKVSTDPNKWFHPGTLALHKVEKLLLNKRLLTDVSKLSSFTLASSLESFHKIILRFIPKNSDFRYVGMMCRLYLAGMHQNENAKRKQAVSKKGKALYKVPFPKYRKGRGTFKPIKTNPTFGYVASLMRLVFNEVFPDPSKFMAQLKSVPETKDLCADFERTPKEDVTAAQGLVLV